MNRLVANRDLLTSKHFGCLGQCGHLGSPGFEVHLRFCSRVDEEFPGCTVESDGEPGLHRFNEVDQTNDSRHTQRSRNDCHVTGRAPLHCCQTAHQVGVEQSGLSCRERLSAKDAGLVQINRSRCRQSRQLPTDPLEHLAYVGCPGGQIGVGE